MKITLRKYGVNDTGLNNEYTLVNPTMVGAMRTVKGFMKRLETNPERKFLIFWNVSGAGMTIGGC